MAVGRSQLADLAPWVHPGGEISAKNIALLTGQLSLAGAEKQAYLLARSLLRAGRGVSVLVWSPTGEDFYLGKLQQQGAEIAAPPRGSGRAAKVRWLRRWARQHQPAVMHSMAFYLNAAAAFAMRGLPGVAVGALRTQLWLHASTELAPVMGGGELSYRLNRHWPAAMICNSEAARQACLDDRGFFRVRNPLLLRNGLEVSEHKPAVHGVRDPVRVIGVGNLHIFKRWDRALRVAAAVRARRPELRFTLDIAGQGGQEPALRQQVAALGLSDRVTLLGRRDDVPSLLSLSDVCILFSDVEGTPNTVMEAMAAGLPVVATAVGDVPRLIEEGKHGFLAAPDNEDLLAERLASLLLSAELRARLGAAARAKAEREFAVDSLGDAALEAYRRAGAALDLPAARAVTVGA